MQNKTFMCCLMGLLT